MHSGTLGSTDFGTRILVLGSAIFGYRTRKQQAGDRSKVLGFRGTADNRSVPVSRGIEQFPQSPCTSGCHPWVAPTRDHPDELDPGLFVHGQLVPRSRRGRGQHEDRIVVHVAHFPKIPRSAARDRAVILGSALSEASRNSASQPCSLTVAGVPKMSTIAFAAVAPTAWSSARRMR